MPERLPYVVSAVSGPAPGGRGTRYALTMSNGEHEQHDKTCRPHDPFQYRIMEWMGITFGSYIVTDQIERRDRFGEEAMELVQALGGSADEMHKLVDYVFGRPVGEPEQEVGGVMVTLAALCGATGLNMHVAGEVEHDRIWSPEIMDKIRAKQRGKPDFGPLPGPSEIDIPAPPPHHEEPWSTEAALRNILREMVDIRGGQRVILDRAAIEALIDPSADAFTVTWEVPRP